MANWSEPKDNYQGGDEVTPDIFNNLAVNEKYLKGEKDKHDTRLTSVEGRATNLEKRATAIEGRATELEKRTDQAEKDIDAVEGRATSLESRSTALEGRATQNENDIDALEGRATSLEQNKIESDDVQNANVDISQAPTRTNLGTRETIKSIFGKIKKWFSDLKALAFKDKIKSTDIDGTIPASIISGKVAEADEAYCLADINTNVKVKAEQTNELNLYPGSSTAKHMYMNYRGGIEEVDLRGGVYNKKGKFKAGDIYSNDSLVVTESNFKSVHDSKIAAPTKSSIGLGNVANERQYSSANPPPKPTALVDAGDSSKEIKAQYSGSWHGVTDGIAMWDGYKVVAVKYSDLVAAIKADIGSSGAFRREVLWTSTTPNSTIKYPAAKLVKHAIYEFRCNLNGDDLVFYGMYEGDYCWCSLNVCTRGYMTDSWIRIYNLAAECWSESIECYGTVTYSEADYPAETSQEGYPCYQFSRMHYA